MKTQTTEPKSVHRHTRRGFRGFDHMLEAQVKGLIAGHTNNMIGSREFTKEVGEIAQKSGIDANTGIVKFFLAILAILLPTIIARAIARGLANMKGVSTQVFDLKGGGILTVLEGPTKSVMAAIAVHPDVRTIVLAGVDSYSQNGNAVIGFVSDIDGTKKVSIPKALMLRFTQNIAYSWIGAMKTLKGRDGSAPRILAYGQNMALKAVRDFVQALAQASYEGNKLRGDRVSQSIFYAPDADLGFGSWPVNAPDLYTTITSQPTGAKVAFLGSYGLIAALPNGDVMVARIEDLLDNASKAWNKVAALPFKPGTDIEDVSIAFKEKAWDGTSTTFNIAVITRDHQMATIMVTAKADVIQAKIKDGVMPIGTYAGALLGTYKGAAVLRDTNGGPEAFSFIPRGEAKEYGVPTFALAAIEARPPTDPAPTPNA